MNPLPETGLNEREHGNRKDERGKQVLYESIAFAQTPHEINRFTKKASLRYQRSARQTEAPHR
jgi:hypothetical protein